MARFRHKRSGEAPELDVTTFMNLMVVLVPFLLMSAAFTELSVHDLNLPTISEGSSGGASDRKLALEVVIRKNELDVMDRNGGRLKLIPNVNGAHDFASLNAKMKEIKGAYPAVTSVTLLLEPDVHYEKLISTMDAVRTFDQKLAGGKVQKADLFPDVSIGDAPPGGGS